MSSKRKLVLGRKRVQHHRAAKRARQQNAVGESLSGDESMEFQNPYDGQQVFPEYENSDDSECSGEVDRSKDGLNVSSTSYGSTNEHNMDNMDIRKSLELYDNDDTNLNTETLSDQQFVLSPEFEAGDDVELYFSDDGLDFSSTEDTDEEDDVRPASVTEEDVEELDEYSVDHNEAEELKMWALSGNPPIAHTRLDQLLMIFRRRLIPDLPKSSKTFLKTSKAKYNIEVNEDKSEFVYFGMTEQLKSTVNPSLHADKVIYLLINVDGLQLYRSSSKQFWPILCLVFSEENIYKPFPAAIYSGITKPSDLNQFLGRFVAEINELQAQGLIIDGKKFKIRIKSFICDRPARALLKCIKNHGAYWACEKCEVRGERFARRTIYPVDGLSTERTDNSFRQQSNADHHTGESLLLDIQPPVNMITTFVLDFMHLVCLGVMKKLLGLWLDSKLRIRLNYTSKTLLTNLLLQLQNQIPCEFQRTTRALTEISRFKAVEFKFILLYAGPVIFKNVLPTNVYKHFLLLHVACRILCSKTEAVLHCALAKELLKKFATLMPRLYGKESLIGNIHNLIHLADDVINMGCSIFNFTAFPFENALGRIKKFLRSGNRPLAQICRRLHETFSINFHRVQPEPNLKILRELRPDQEGKIIIKRVKYNNSTITTKVPDNTVLLDNGILLQVDNMYRLPGRINDVQISGTVLKKKRPLFTYPCDSSSLHMWVVVKENKVSGPYSLSHVMQKMVMLEVNNERKQEVYAMPLLHM